ncbi:MAG: MFS transporter [Xanthobacteraceae bacterium]
MSRKPLLSSAAIVLAVGFLVLFIGGGARFAIGLTLKSVVEDFGWGRTELGVAVALFQLVSAVCMYFAGVMADRTNPRLVLSGGLIIAGVGIGLMSLMAAPWHALLLYGVVFAIGNGAASLIPVGVMVTRSFPHRIGLANAVVMSGMSVGQLVMIAALAAVLVAIGWRSVFAWLGVAHLLPLPLLLAMPGKGKADAHHPPRPLPGLAVAETARTRQFWLLLAIYALCGFDDFFVTTHLVAFAQDRGLDPFIAGNLLALMGLAALLGVIAAGAWSDRSGPARPAAASFAARIAVFALVLVDQSPTSVTIFALMFGVTFLVTAPLTVPFVAESFGMRNLGGLLGLITMVHHICGGIGAYLGAAVFDATGGYDRAFAVMMASSILALALTFCLNRPPRLRFVKTG